MLCAAFINFSEVLSRACYSASFNTITLYALFSEPCLPFSYSSQTEDPLVFCLPIVWREARSPRQTIEVLTTYLLQFFLFIIHFVLSFILNMNFYFDQYSAHPVAKTAKSELRFCSFVILLFLLLQLVSIRNEDLQTNPDRINYNKRP